MPGKIIIVDGVATNRIALKARLSSSFYEVIQASDAKTALSQIKTQVPDVILIASDLADMSGQALCTRLRAEPETSVLPIIMIAPHHDRASRMAALAAGADEVLCQPLDTFLLMARLRSLLRNRVTSEELRLREIGGYAMGFADVEARYFLPGRVTIVAPDRQQALRWKVELSKHSRHRMGCCGLDEMMSLSGPLLTPDAFVLAVQAGRHSATMRLISELHSRDGARESAIIAVPTDSATDLLTDVLDRGGDDVLVSGFDAEELALRLDTLIARKRQADWLHEEMRDGLRAAMIDPLTSLYNRRYAMPRLVRIAENAELTGEPFAVLVLDLDHFKTVNDAHGHAAGDEVLVRVAALLTANLRENDLIARIGGEEFLIVMPQTGIGHAQRIAARLCDVIARERIDTRSSAQSLRVTASIGLAMSAAPGPGVAQDVQTIVEEADKALYLAKAQGRNRVLVSSDCPAA